MTSQTVRARNTDTFQDEEDIMDASLEWKKKMMLPKGWKSHFCHLGLNSKMRPWSSWKLNYAAGQGYYLEKSFFFICLLIIVLLTPSFFLLYFFFCELFRNTRTKTDWLSIGKRDRFVEKGSLLHWKITTFPISIAFFQFAWWSVFISCSFFYWSIHSSSKGLKRSDQLIYLQCVVTIWEKKILTKYILHCIAHFGTSLNPNSGSDSEDV